MFRRSARWPPRGKSLHRRFQTNRPRRPPRNRKRKWTNRGRERRRGRFAGGPAAPDYYPWKSSRSATSFGARLCAKHQPQRLGSARVPVLLQPFVPVLPAAAGPADTAALHCLRPGRAGKFPGWRKRSRADLETTTKVRRKLAPVAELESCANPHPGKAALRSKRFPACGSWRLSTRQMAVLVDPPGHAPKLAKCVPVTVKCVACHSNKLCGKP